jgi:hypothetical protein
VPPVLSENHIRMTVETSLEAVALCGPRRYGRHGGHPLRAEARDEEAAVARPVDGASTNESGCGRAC